MLNSLSFRRIIALRCLRVSKLPLEIKYSFSTAGNQATDVTGIPISSSLRNASNAYLLDVTIMAILCNDIDTISAASDLVDKELESNHSMVLLLLEMLQQGRHVHEKFNVGSILSHIEMMASKGRILSVNALVLIHSFVSTP